MKVTVTRLKNSSDCKIKQYRVKGSYIKSLSELNRVIYPTILRITKPVKKTLREITEHALLDLLAPVAVLVNASGNALYIHGHTGLYLEMVTGLPGITNIIKMARKGLQKPLISALHKAVSKQITVTTTGIRVQVNHDFIWVDLTVSPLEKALVEGYDTALYLIILEQKEMTVSETEKNTEVLSRSDGFENQVEISSFNELNFKKLELEEMGKALKTTKIEIDASQEALKRFNKYVDESKAELQSLADNLEIKKEERNTLEKEIDIAKGVLDAVDLKPETNNHELFEVEKELENIKYELLSISEELNSKKLELEITKDELLTANEEQSSKEFEIEKTKDKLLTINEELRLKELELEKIKEELLNTHEVLNSKKIELENINFQLIIKGQEFEAEQTTWGVAEEDLFTGNKRESAIGVKQNDINDIQAVSDEPFVPIPLSEVGVSENSQKYQFVDSKRLDEFGVEEHAVPLHVDSSILQQKVSQMTFNDVTEFNTASTHGFRHDSSIKSVSIPEGVERLKRSMFYKCEQLETVILPTTLKFIDDFVFYGCEKLTSVSLENCTALEYVGTSAFEGCVSLVQIRIPSSTVEIEAAAFLGCKKMEIIEFLENSQLEIIGSHVFKDCESMQSIRLPGNLKQMGMSIFYGCRGLKNIELPNKLETIGEHAFWGCDSLREIFVPNKKIANQPGFTVGLPKEIKLKF